MCLLMKISVKYAKQVTKSLAMDLNVQLKYLFVSIMRKAPYKQIYTNVKYANLGIT